MEEQQKQPPATNNGVAEKLGMSHSGVSRLRTGDRYPNRRTMRKIEEVYGWKVADQMDTIPTEGRDRRWADAFEAVLARAN